MCAASGRQAARTCQAKPRLYWSRMSASQALPLRPSSTSPPSRRRSQRRRPRRLAALRFRGLNPIAADVTGVARQGGHLATRRWYYLIPASGEPRGLVHAIERALARAPAGHDRALCRTRTARGGPADAARRLAPRRDGIFARAARSRTSRASTPAPSSCVRQSGVDVVSSGDLVQRFAAVWDDRADRRRIVEASEKLYRVKDRAFDDDRAPPARRRRRRPSTTSSS